jgi:hypothetical protein
VTSDFLSINIKISPMYFPAKYSTIKLLISLSIFAKSFIVAGSPSSLHLSNEHISVKLDGRGTIQQFIVLNRGHKDTISFRLDKFAGPAFDSIEMHQAKKGQPVFSAEVNNIVYKLEYKLTSEALMIVASLKNESETTFKPDVIRLRSGINNYQDFYPKWRKILFPTLLRSEKTHFWGYFMSPEGTILSVASPNPIPSWTIGYERFEKFPHYEGSHRIQTSYLELLRADILHNRQPVNRKLLEPGEEIRDTFFLNPLQSLNDLGKTMSLQTQAPFLSFNKYTLFPGEKTLATINSTSALTKILIKPEGSAKAKAIDFREVSPQVYQFEWIAPENESRYVVQVTNVNKKQSEAILYVRANWSDYLVQARKSGLRYLPTTTPNTEAFYPLYSYFLARKHVPDSTEDALTEQVFKDVFAVLFDPKVREMSTGKTRIQNAANMAAILADRYEVTRDTNDLVNANGLIEFLMRNQGKDGGYYSYRDPQKPMHYSCVNYVTKTFMEVLTQEYKLAQTSEVWKKRYNAGYVSVQRALKDLIARKDNLGTEGQMTFDDTTISCSIGQLAMAALRTSDPELKKELLNTALEMYNQHRCLTQLKIPDARMNGATLRFWESQFTVNLMNNMMNSPCGWSAWKIYGTYYLYLLTGEKGFLYETMNALGTCSQLINLKNGTLYFAFIPDPYIKGEQFKPAYEGSKIPTLQPVVVGEQYLPLISDWHTPPFYAWRPGVFGIDNFVHEVIKAIEEVAIQQAYVVENEDGSFESFNCKLEQKEGKLMVTPYEKLVKNVHVNLKKIHNIVVMKSNETIHYNNITGLKWLGEVPEDIRTYEKM